MTMTNFINDCVKCISMCNKEFSSEFAEWIEKLILTEVAGNSKDKLEDDSKEKSFKGCFVDNYGITLSGDNVTFKSCNEDK